METMTPPVDDLSPSTTSFQSKLQLWEHRSWNTNSPKEEQDTPYNKKPCRARSAAPPVFRETRTNNDTRTTTHSNHRPKRNFSKGEIPKPLQLRVVQSSRPPVLRETTNTVQNTRSSGSNNNKIPWENKTWKSKTPKVEIKKSFQRQPSHFAFRETTNVNPRTTQQQVKKQSTATFRNNGNPVNKKSVLARYNPTPNTTLPNKARPVVPRQNTSKSGQFQSSFAIFEDPPTVRASSVRQKKKIGKVKLLSLLETLETVRQQCKGKTGCLDIQGLCSPDTVETIPDLDRCEWTADEVANIRVVLLPPDRQHIMDAIGRFLFGFQFHCRRRQLKPSFLEKLVQCLETLDRLYQLEMDKNPPLLFNILLGTTYHLYMELPKFKTSAFPKELSSMLAHLMQRWKDLVALYTLPQLKVDSEFSYPATQVLTAWLESVVSPS